jgi:hypothetical protein
MASADTLTYFSPSALTNFYHLDQPTTSRFPSSAIRKQSRSFSKHSLTKMSPKSQSQEASGKVVFDAGSHLAFTETPNTFTMKDIGFPDDKGISTVAVSEPFQLFSADAVEQMRTEIFGDKVWENCQYSSNLSSCQLRGYAAE